MGKRDLALTLWRGPAWKRNMELKSRVNRVFELAEKRGLYRACRMFNTDYLGDYPELSLLETNHATIRRECERLLERPEELVRIERLGGSYTAGGINTIQWSTFVFKLTERFIPENCALCPETAALLSRVPKLHTAFFSVLAPGQYIKPHRGYYKGYLRYHLGVIVPGGSAQTLCAMRMNANAAGGLTDDEMLSHGDTYAWREGRGVLFDDTFLHDSWNNSDAVRVVLWLDLERKMPWYLTAFGRLVLAIAYADRSVKAMRETAVAGRAAQPKAETTAAQPNADTIGCAYSVIS